LKTHLIFLATLTVAGLLSFPHRSVAQYAPDSRPITLSVGGMLTPAAESQLTRGWDLMAGGGFAVSPRAHHRSWRLYLTGNFMFEHLGVTADAFNQVKTFNPSIQNATGARARFYAATLDPNVRIRVNRRVSWYGVGGFGWLQRSIDYTAPHPWEFCWNLTARPS
jgi:hypothetical protein